MEEAIREKREIIYQSIKLVVYFVLAIMTVVFREFHLENLGTMIGVLMLLYGVEEIVFEWIFFPHQFRGKSKTYIGIIEIILGITFICLQTLTYEGVCVGWAVWSMVRESYELKEIVTDLHRPLPKVLSFLESVTAIVFSVMLIIEPGEHHAGIHLYLLFVELVFNPLVPLLDLLLVKRKEKKEKAKESAE